MTDKSAEEALAPTAHPLSDEPAEPQIAALSFAMRWLSAPYLQSYACFSLYMSIGFALGCTGTLLPLIAQNTNSTLAATGALFTARGVGWISGSLVAGMIPIFDWPWLPPNYLMFLCSVGVVAYFLSLPYLKDLYAALLSTVIAGVFWAWADVRANTLIFAVWGARAGSWMQALHFFFGVGASVAPAGIAIVLGLCPPSTQLLVSCVVLAVLSLAAAILPALLPPRGVTEHSKAEGISAAENTDTQLTRKIIIVFLTSVFLFVYVGIESAYGGWLLTYAEEYFPEMPPWEAASLTSAFWIATTIGRLLAVPVLTIVSHRTILRVCLLSALPSGIFLVLMPGMHASKYALWVTTVYYGLTMAPVYASGFAMPSELGFEVTHSTSSWLIVGSIGGDMAVPALMGLFITWKSHSLAWAVLIAGIVLLGICGTFVVLTQRWTNAPRRNAEELTVLTKDVTEPSSAP